MQQPIPRETEFGKWDKLPDEVTVISSTDEKLLDMVSRRAILKKMHLETARGTNEPGRSWSLRQNHYGYSFLNGRIKKHLTS